MPDENFTQSTKSIVKPKRGRPAGTFKHRKDKSLLLQAARYVNTGYAASPREAFSKLTDDDDNAIRRLQRRWKIDGDELLHMDRIGHLERCELEYRQLRSAYPKLWVRIAEFVKSPSGRRFMKKFTRADGEPTHPMALGLAFLMEAIEDHEKKGTKNEPKTAGSPEFANVLLDPTNRSQANEHRFDLALEGWFTGGLAITPLALRALAERAGELADAIEADKSGEPNQ